MEPNFIGYDQQVCTFLCGPRVKTRDFVFMTGNYEVDTCRAYSNSANIQFIGKCIAVHGGLATIQLSGYVEGCTEEKIPLGYQHLVVNGENKIRIGGPSDKQRLVIYSKENNVGFIL